MITDIPLVMTEEEWAKATSFIALRTISLLNLDTQTSGGSGTLACAKGVYGILTAAHVAECLPDAGEIGLVFVDHYRRYQQTRFRLELVHRVCLGETPFGPLGPDISFLRLPDVDAARISANGAVFLNLEKQKEQFNSAAAHRCCRHDILVGEIQQSARVSDFGDRKTRSSETRATKCQILREFQLKLTDYPAYDVVYVGELGSDLPKSFEGTSGGALWCLFHDGKCITDPQLRGVPFYEHGRGTEERIVICHGPRTIFDVLLQKVEEECSA